MTAGQRSVRGADFVTCRGSSRLIKMISMRISTLFLLCAVLLGACRSFSERSSDSPAGTYSYVAYDADGEKVVAGVLQIGAIRGVENRSYLLEGTWDMKAVGNSKEEIGPQLGKGRLIGTVDADGSYWIDLNPDFRDNNVMLHGQIAGRIYEEIEGEWQHVTLIGPANEGSFEAVRQSPEAAE